MKRVHLFIFPISAFVYFCSFGAQHRQFKSPTREQINSYFVECLEQGKLDAELPWQESIFSLNEYHTFLSEAAKLSHTKIFPYTKSEKIDTAEKFLRENASIVQSLEKSDFWKYIHTYESATYERWGQKHSNSMSHKPFFKQLVRGGYGLLLMGALYYVVTEGLSSPQNLVSGMILAVICYMSYLVNDYVKSPLSQKDQLLHRAALSCKLFKILLEHDKQKKAKTFEQALTAWLKS